MKVIGKYKDPDPVILERDGLYQFHIDGTIQILIKDGHITVIPKTNCFQNTTIYLE
jgi:hypothetical protein